MQLHGLETRVSHVNRSYVKKQIIGDKLAFRFGSLLTVCRALLLT